MKKFLALLVTMAMMLSMIAIAPASPAYAAGAGDGFIRRRALVIGNAQYAQSALQAPEYDAKHMAELFKQMSFSGTTGSAAETGAFASITSYTNQTRRQMLNDIASAFAGADEDDVSYFYYSGHGSVDNSDAQIVGVDLAFLSLTDLKNALDAVPGTKVIILDSCFSGGFINKSSTTIPAQQSPGALAANVARNADAAGPKAPVATLKKAKSGSTADLFPFALKRKPADSGDPVDVQFNKSVGGAFAKAPKYLNNSSYIVLSAASMNEYSYEMPFNSLYGPSFIMNGVDYAERTQASSGEFTGMLIAGAGEVTFSSMYGVTGPLADYNGDKKLTAAELEHYLMGSVLFSDVRVYPSAADSGANPSPVVFSHDAGMSVTTPRVRLSNGTADITTPVNNTSVPIALDLSGIPDGIQKNLVIYKFPKTTDGTGINGNTDQITVRKFENVASGVTTWDGKDADGNPAGDGIYKIILECGEGATLPNDPPFLYPGTTVVLARNQSEYNAGNELVLSAIPGSASNTASGNVGIAQSGDMKSFWFTANATGAMNVYADASTLTGNLLAVCMLYDADGNVVNFSQSSVKDKELYLPFYVEKDKVYRLKFGITHDPELSGDDIGQYAFRLQLNSRIGIDAPTIGLGNGYEAWFFQPDTAAAGDYVLQSSGRADTAAVIVDSNQTSEIGENDDFNDWNFLIKAPLIAGHGYLLIVKDSGPSGQFNFTVHSPANAPVFDTGSIPAISYDAMGYDEEISDADGKTTYRLIHTGPSDPEKWYFYGGGDSSLSDTNDPCLQLMDDHYNKIGFSDDYDSGFNSAFAVVLDPNKTYILACRSAAETPYDYDLSALMMPLTTSDYVVSKPKAVFTDDGGLSLDRYGTVSSWGYNGYGELGLGTVTPSPTPAVVMLPEYEQAVDIWAGEVMGFARLKDGGYCCWGLNISAPVTVTSLDGLDVADIKSDCFGDSLVLTYTGELYMLDPFDDTIQLISLPGEGAHSAKQIAATEESFLALASDGKLFSWGANWTGECGVGSTSPVAKPTQIAFGSGVLISGFTSGWDHVLAVSSAGAVYAWGNNTQDQLGQGASYTNKYSSLPVKIAGGDISGKIIASVYAGVNHSMCVDAAGNAYGWGSNAYAEFGFGDAARAALPRQIKFYGPGKVPVQSMSAGVFAVFAQDFTSDIYGYGANLDYQLGFAGQPPDEAITKLMTLRGDVVATHSTALKTLHLDNGLMEASGNSITVTIGEDSPSCYFVPETADSEATYQIDGVSVTGMLVAVATPGSQSAPLQITVSHPGGIPADTVYTLVVKRQTSMNDNLRSLGLTAGVSLSPALSMGETSYKITLPETMASVKVSPVADGYGAKYKMDDLPYNTGRTFTLAIGQTMYCITTVTAQSGDSQDYNLTISRPLMLSGFSASPVVNNYPSLAPGGTNRMTVKYYLSFPASVKLEVQKGSKWYTVMSRKDTSAGWKSWTWDGKVNGHTLAYGTYKLRMTPTYAGKVCTAKTLTVKILNKPSVTISSLRPYTFTPDGKKWLEFSVKWTKITDVQVQIVNSSGSVVYTAFSAASQAPATMKFIWNGLVDGMYNAPAGTYRVKVTCGTVVKYKTFHVKH